jgi:hypothetical protein
VSRTTYPAPDYDPTNLVELKPELKYVLVWQENETDGLMHCRVARYESMSPEPRTPSPGPPAVPPSLSRLVHLGEDGSRSPSPTTTLRPVSPEGLDEFYDDLGAPNLGEDIEMRPESPVVPEATPPAEPLVSNDGPIVSNLDEDVAMPSSSPAPEVEPLVVPTPVVSPVRF